MFECPSVPPGSSSSPRRGAPGWRKAPFTDAEWEERKQYRSFDIMRFGYACLGIFLAYRLTNEWPVVWCDDSVEEKAPPPSSTTTMMIPPPLALGSMAGHSNRLQPKPKPF